MSVPLRTLVVCGLLLMLTGTLQAQTEAPASAPAPSTSDQREPNPEEAQAQVPFEGIDWRLTAYRDESGPIISVTPRSRPTEFRFEAGRFSGSTGCNRVQGGYAVEGDTLRLGDGLAATRMACPEPLMKQETVIFKALQRVTGYRQGVDRLELTDDRGETVLSFTRIGAATGVTEDPTQALEGRTWVVEALAATPGILSPPLPGTRIDLSFDPRGRISGSDGCNRYLSGFMRTPSSLSFGPIATTQMACTATDGRAEQARTYAGLLGRVSAYRIEDGHLLLLDARGALLVRLRAIATN